MTTAQPADVHAGGEAAPADAVPGLGWRTVLGAAAIASAATFLAVGVALGDMEAGAYAVAYAAGAGVSRWRGGRLGAGLLALANLNVLVWMSLGALSNVTASERAVFVVVPALLAGLALVGAVSALVVLVRPAAPCGWAPWALTAVVAAAVAVAWGAAATTGTRSADPADVLRVTSDNVAFADTELAAPPGDVTVRVGNSDLFWHTFTIDELGVDLWVPVGAERDVTFDATPGTYEYYCRIPGHEARMRGTFLVE